MTVWTKRGVEIAAAYDAAGEARKVANGEMQVWMTEAERAIDGAAIGRIDQVTWAELSAITGETEGQPAQVVGPDAGTHADPVTSATVENEGSYIWSSAPAGWRRVGGLPNEIINATNIGTGTANDIQATTVPVGINNDPYQALISVNFVAANNGAMTLSLNGETPRALVTNTGAPVPPGYVQPNMAALAQIDGNGDYRFFSYGDAAAIQAAAEAARDAAEAARDAAQSSASAIDSSKLTQIRRYQVDHDNILRDPFGSRFVAKGAQMFAYAFVQHEYRDDYRYRTSQGTLTLADGTVVTTGAGTGISEPTYYAKYMWKSASFVAEQIAYAAAAGMNLIQVSVEPAMQFTPSYIDHVDGLVYPSEMDMLDVIIDRASDHGMVVMLRPTNDQPPIAQRADFLEYLASRYMFRCNVMLHTANEINCFGIRQSDGSLDPNPNCQLPAAWAADQVTLISAIRSTGFLNPVVINSTNYGGDISQVLAELDSYSAFTDDPNLIIGTHHYKRDADTDYVTARWGETETEWAAGLDGRWCCLIDEVGSTNVAGRYDPELEPDDPPADPTEWANTQTYLRQFLRWCAAACADGRLHGIVAFNWGAYFPHFDPPVHDKNSLRKVGTDNNWSNWGEIFRVHFLEKSIETVTPAQCRLIKDPAGGVTLVPFNGNKVPISGRMRTLPKSGINFDTSILAADTLFYVFARISSGQIILEASETGYREDWFRNIPVKNDNPDATLVGMVYRDSTAGAVSTEQNRLVRSWFNRPVEYLRNHFTADRALTSTTFSEVDPEIRVQCLAWPNERLDISFDGQVTQSTGSLIRTGIWQSGTVSDPTAGSTAWDSTGKQMHHSVRWNDAVNSGGLKMIRVHGLVTAGTGTWKSGGYLQATLLPE